MAGAAGSELSRGGMQTKIEAAKIATVAGTTMVIASGREDHPLRRIAAGERCTWFLAEANPVTARKTWISGRLETRGALVIDEGAARALRAGKSLLPAGVRRVEGRFQRGDAVNIVGMNGEEIGRGLVAYDTPDAERIAGRNSREIEALLGFAGRAEMIHRDDMALRDQRTDDWTTMTDVNLSSVSSDHPFLVPATLELLPDDVIGTAEQRHGRFGVGWRLDPEADPAALRQNMVAFGAACRDELVMDLARKRHIEKAVAMKMADLALAELELTASKRCGASLVPGQLETAERMVSEGEDWVMVQMTDLQRVWPD